MPYFPDVGAIFKIAGNRKFSILYRPRVSMRTNNRQGSVIKVFDSIDTEKGLRRLDVVKVPMKTHNSHNKDCLGK